MARNTWDSSRDNNDSIMRRGDDRTIDYGRSGDTFNNSRRGNEYRSGNFSDRMNNERNEFRHSQSQSQSHSTPQWSADREDSYIEDRDMSFAERDRSRSNPNRYESSRFASDRYTADRNQDRYDSDRMNGGTFSRDASASSRTTYGQPSYGQPNYSQSNYGQQNYGQSNYGQSHSSQSAWSAATESQGTHAGKGPKGYRRSDDRIREEVSDALERHPHIDASELEVDVKDGVVTLRGHVEERRIKRMAEDAIENLPGVRDVRNELMVDQSLFQRAKEALFGTNLENETASSQSTKSTSTRSKH